MSFDVVNMKAQDRMLMSESDLEQSVKCLNCKIFPICGGWGEFDDSRWCTMECDYCRAVCCKRPGAVDIIKDVGGLGIMKVRWKPFDMDDLPPVIPQLNSQSYGVKHPAYGVSAKKLYYPHTDGWAKEKDLKKRFKIPEASKLILSFSIKDVILDSWLRNLDKACKNLSEYNFDYALAPNFSMYGNYPPLDRLVNLRRQFFMMERLQEYGVKVIPGVEIVRTIDMKRLAKWCRVNRPPMVFLNMTMRREHPTEKEWQWRIDTFIKFREMCGYPIQYIVIGASGPRRLKNVIERLGGVIFYDTKTYRFAEFHRKVWDSLWDKSKSVRDLFFENLEYLNWVYESTMEEQT